MRQMEDANNPNMDQYITEQIDALMDESDVKSATENQTEQTSVMESQTSGIRSPCKFAGCVSRTTKGFCFKHHPDNAKYNQERYKQKQHENESKILGFLGQIEELNDKVKELESIIE